MKTLKIIRNAAGVSGMIVAIILANDMQATGKEILASAVLAILGVAILLLPIIENEVSQQPK